MQMTQAIEGFRLDLAARSYSPDTIKLYGFLLGKLAESLGDPEVGAVKPAQLADYLNTMREAGLSGSSMDNVWKAVRSFYNWASEALDVKRPDSKMPRPKFKLPEVQEFSEAEIKRLIEGCKFTREAQVRPGKKAYRMRRPTAGRDIALVYVLLDTGLRIGELLRVKLRDVTPETGDILVAPYGRGYKTTPRVVRLGAASRQAVWLYLAKRKDKRPDDKLFPMPGATVRSILLQLGIRANVKNCHPHRFRHSFAIYYLRNGGDVFSLQYLLGHKSLEMVRHYLALAQTDVSEAHRKASPVDRMRL
jgi:integrase/recombinase XerD